MYLKARKRKFFYTFVLALVFVGVKSVAQKNLYSFAHLNTEQGLSNNSVTCILKDSHGFIWIGTTNGLNRYDGNALLVYRHDPADATSISDNFISNIKEDASGNLWIGTQGGGLNVFDPVFEKFRYYLHQPGNAQSLSSDFVYHHNSMLSDHDGMLWIGTDNGFNSIRHTENVFSRHKLHASSYDQNKLDNIRVIADDNNGNLWLGTNTGLVQFSKTKGFVRIFSDRSKSFITNNIVTALAVTIDNKGLFIGTEEGMNYLDFATETIQHFYNTGANTLSDNSITSVVADNTGSIWIGTKSGGLNLYNPRTGVFQNWKFDPLNAKGISDNYIDYLYFDNKGLLWIGTVNTGVNILDIHEKKFALYNNNPRNTNSLSYNTIRSLYEDAAGAIWIGTYGGGLNKYDGKHFTHFLHNPYNPASISHNIVSAIYEPEPGTIWLGTWGGGLNSLQTSTGLCRRNIFNISEYIHAITEDTYHNVWICSNNGLFLYRKQQKTIERFDSDTDTRQQLSATSVERAVWDGFGNLWVATFNGLNRLTFKNIATLETDSVYIYRNNPSDTKSISDNRIIALYNDSYNNLWVCTYASGLNKVLFSKTGQPVGFKKFAETEGLAGNTVYGIAEDNKHNLWLSTNNGLSKFNIASEQFVNFNIDDGLQGNEFYWGAYLKARSGKMYFGGMNGLNAFDPDSIISNLAFPKAEVTSLLIFNKPVKAGKQVDGDVITSKSISYSNKVTLTRKNYAFTFEFSALQYTSQAKIKFAYKLENFDNTWINTDYKKRYATYSHLRPGTYHFLLKVSNEDGAWSKDIKNIKVVVAPAIWETYWAFALYGFIILLLLYNFRLQILSRVRYKHSLQLARIEREKSEEYNNLKLRFFTNISHEFRTPLTLILGPVESLSASSTLDDHSKQQLAMAQHGIKRLLKLINQLLEFRKVETGNAELHVGESNIVSFLENIIELFRARAQAEAITYTFQTPVPHANVWFDENIIETIVYNLLSNAFKFTNRGGNITISLQFEPANNNADNYTHATIKVSDSGLGIAPDKLHAIFKPFFQVSSANGSTRQGTGLGLALCKELVSIHKGEISVQSIENEGSAFEINIPVSRQSFEPHELVAHIAAAPKQKLPDTDDEAHTNHIATTPEFQNNYQNKSKILVIEDDLELLAYISGLFKYEYALITATNGTDGLRLAIDEIPDLILSDIMMPGFDGWQVCDKLKHTINTSHIPVILLTALSAIDDKIKGTVTGADDYISKPFNPTYLKAKVVQLLEQRNELRRYFQRAFAFKPEKLAIPSMDEKFIEKVNAIIDASIADTQLSVETISNHVNMSSTHLYRKLKALTGLSTNEYVRKVRLRKAAQLLVSGQGNVSQVMLDVGFTNNSYFAKCFQDEFGMSPREYIATNG